jgi:hypothetical protein
MQIVASLSGENPDGEIGITAQPGDTYFDRSVDPIYGGNDAGEIFARRLQRRSRRRQQLRHARAGAGQSGTMFSRQPDRRKPADQERIAVPAGNADLSVGDAAHNTLGMKVGSEGAFAPASVP